MHVVHDRRSHKWVTVATNPSVRRTLVEQQCQGDITDPKKPGCERLQRFFIGSTEAESHGRRNRGRRG